MLQGRDDGSAATLPPIVAPPVPIVPPPPVLPPAPAPAPLPPAQHTETLAEAESIVRALVAQGLLPAQALAQHPLPMGTSTADALAFLATLPQSTTPIDNVDAGVITGPPIDTLTGDGPFDDSSIDPTAYDGFDFEPFVGDGGGEAFSTSDAKILRGAAFVNYVRSECAKRGIDPLVAFALAVSLGISGRIGANGLAYGPWQLHLTTDSVQQFNGLPPYNNFINAWAWTANGIEYAVRSMVWGGAKGKRGHAAIHAIVFKWNNFPHTEAEYKIRAGVYDFLLAKGSAVNTYIAGLANGPSLVTTPGDGTTTKEPTPKSTPISTTPTGASWKSLMSFLATDVPFAANHSKTLSSGLVSNFK